MHWRLLVFSLSVLSVALLPRLPGIVAIVLLALTAVAMLAVRRLRLPALALLGFCWGVTWGHWQLADRLPLSMDKSDYRVSGFVTGLPEANQRRTRFTLAVSATEALATQAAAPSLNKLLLSWYGAPALQPGDFLTLDVRLRSPRGFSNPGGFDYNLWLLQQGFSATGYVRRQPTAPPGNSRTGGLSQVRYRIREHIRQLPMAADIKGYISALTLGDKSLLSPQAWDRLQATGTVHLVVVSGLHMGMVAVFGMLVGVVIGRLLLLLGILYPARRTGAWVALCCAVVYALISGFGLPAQRSLVMVVVALGGLLLGRNIGPGKALCWALVGISLVDPLAAMRPGFWLSFVAVFGLLFWFVPRRARNTGWIRGIVESQFVVLLFLSGHLLYFQGQLPLSAPLINLLVVPWVSMGIVPLCLLGAILVPFERLSAMCWQGAGWQLGWFDRLLQHGSENMESWTWWYSGPVGLWMVAGFLSIAVLLSIPGITGGRLLVVPVLVALLFPERHRAQEDFSVTVLDVGQGLAVVVSTGSRVLVYDTGPAYGPRFNAGSGVITPYLRSRGIHRIDTLVISHGDDDHAGGLDGLLQSFSPERILFSGIEPRGAGDQWVPCQKGVGWQWGVVRFSVLHPAVSSTRSDNDRSCVLLIETPDARVLLPGDIETAGEAALMAAGPPGDVSLLVAPHHGSNSSSGTALIAGLQPRHVVYSAGYKHHFGHPHPAVVDRYRQFDVAQWNTADSGAVTFDWRDDGEPAVREHRRTYRRFWHPPIPAGD